MMKLGEVSVSTSTYSLSVHSTSEPEFIDITEQVLEFVRESEILNGIAVVFSRHTTAAITIQENEPLLLKDLARALEQYSPRNGNYQHNDFTVRTVHMHEDECPNGHSHCQHLVLGTSETIPVIDGTLPLGKWQRIFMVELDEKAPSKPREVLIQVMGV